MTDGTVHWRVRDTRCRYEVGDIIAKMTTPKSYEYLLPCNGSAFDKTKYPLLAKVFSNGKVPDLTDGRFLEGSASAGTSKNAGLPNITGTIRYMMWTGEESNIAGSFRANSAPSYGQGAVGGSSMGGITVSLDASRSCNIYGSSDTVQPKSFTVMYYVCYGG